MRELLLYLFVFVIVYLFYIIFVISRKNVLKKFPDGKEIKYLKYGYKVKVTDKNLKSLAYTVCFVNSFILATTVYVVCLFDNLFIEMLVGIVTLIVLILVLYHIVGLIYGPKKED